MTPVYAMTCFALYLQKTMFSMCKHSFCLQTWFASDKWGFQ